MEFFIIFLLILLNGVFSMSEIAIVSARKSRLQAAATAGKTGAATALRLSSSPDRFLSTVQIGITLVGLLTGIYTGENITNDLEEYLYQYESIRSIADGLSVTIVLVITTFFTVVLGELVPKRIGLASPERISIKVAPWMKTLSTVGYPFVWILTRTSDVFIRLFNVRASTDVSVTEEEVRQVVQEATATGQIEKIEQTIVERVFLLGDRKISSLMTPRSDVAYVNVSDNFSSIRNTVKEDLHRVYPVYEGNEDNIIGVISLKDLFVAVESQTHELRKYVTPAHFLSERTSAYGALEKFKENKVSYAFVFDEYGVVKGMVTMDDILLALVGHASHFQESAYEMKQVSADSWLVDGQYPLAEFLLNVNRAADPPLERILTVAGLILELFHHVPDEGETIRWKGLVFEVVDMDNAKIDKVSVKREADTTDGKMN